MKNYMILNTHEVIFSNVLFTPIILIKQNVLTNVDGLVHGV